MLRIQAPLALLVLLLQRTPVLNHLVRMEALSASGIGALVRSVFAVSMVTGTVHALTGATTFSSTPASPAAASVDVPFTLSFSVTGAPTAVKSYHVTGTLPPGLSIPGLNASGNLNAATGTISGTPTTAGNFTVNIQAYDRIDARGNTDDVLYPVRINVAAAPATAPTITAQPSALTLNVGGSGSFTVTATGSPAPTYQWRKGTTAIPGATAATLSLTGVQTADAGSYSVVVSNSAGSVTSNAAALTVNVPATVPTISTQPRSLMLPVGYGGSLSVAAAGAAPLSYRWNKNGAAIAGATSATLTLTAVQTGDAGDYTVVVSNASGSVTSTVARVSVGTSVARLDNLSSRGFVGGGNQVLIAGLVIEGAAPKSVLIRGVGPGLVPFGLAAGEVLADPLISVKNSAGAEILVNDNWNDAANADIVPAVSASVGAFALASGSKDAVALVTLDPGIYTVVVRGAHGETGIALAEAYELP